MSLLALDQKRFGLVIEQGVFAVAQFVGEHFDHFPEALFRIHRLKDRRPSMQGGIQHVHADFLRPTVILCFSNLLSRGFGYFFSK